MIPYILLIHDNAKSVPTADEWDKFFSIATRSGTFKGGSAIGSRTIIGNSAAVSTNHIGGFMRFDSDDKRKVLDLLEIHPVVLRGGTVELCEMPKT